MIGAADLARAIAAHVYNRRRYAFEYGGRYIHVGNRQPKPENFAGRRRSKYHPDVIAAREARRNNAQAAGVFAAYGGVVGRTGPR